MRIKCPEAWDCLSEGITNPVIGEVLVLLPPQPEDPDGLGIELIVHVHELNQAISLPHFVEKHISFWENRYDSLKLISRCEVETALAELQGCRLIYEVQYGGKHLKFMDVIALNKIKAYVLTYKSPMSEYSKYEKLMKDTIRTFEILDGDGT